jgi:hypothetical protein
LSFLGFLIVAVGVVLGISNADDGRPVEDGACEDGALEV